MSKVETTPKASKTNQQPFLFDKSNYMFMAIGVVLVIIGFILMSGGKSTNPNEFNPKEIYSAQRVTIAPLMILIGFAIEIYAIMKKPSTAAN